MGKPVYILAGGGTGGHLCPGIAVAEALARRDTDGQVVFACSDRELDARFLDPPGYARVVQPVRPLPRSVLGWGRFLRDWHRSQRQAGDMVRDLKPAAVLGLGGFAAGPVVRQAARRGVPTAMLNPDAIPGRANRYLARHVEVIFTQFSQTEVTLSSSQRRKVRRVGCPVRPLEKAPREEARRFFDLREDRRVLLVMGGSSGAASINRAMDRFLPEMAPLAETWQVLQLRVDPEETAADDVGELLVRRVGFCARMGLAYSAADLFLGRGGASTLAELGEMSLPAVIMPYPFHRDMHQLRNAEALERRGAAALCEDRVDPEANAPSLRRVLLPLLRDPARLASMRSAARRDQARPAAEAVVDWMLAAER